MFETTQEYEQAVLSVALTMTNDNLQRRVVERIAEGKVISDSGVAVSTALSAIESSSLTKDFYANTSKEYRKKFVSDVIEEALYQCGYENIKASGALQYVRTDDVLSAHTHTPTKPKETTMDKKATHPVMIGNVNILTADDATLVTMIRDGKALIEEDKDIAAHSSKFQAKAGIIKQNINLCLEQLDGEGK